MDNKDFKIWIPEKLALAFYGFEYVNELIKHKFAGKFFDLAAHQKWDGAGDMCLFKFG